MHELHSFARELSRLNQYIEQTVAEMEDSPRSKEEVIEKISEAIGIITRRLRENGKTQRGAKKVTINNNCVLPILHLIVGNHGERMVFCEIQEMVLSRKNGTKQIPELLEELRGKSDKQLIEIYVSLFIHINNTH